MPGGPNIDAVPRRPAAEAVRGGIVGRRTPRPRRSCRRRRRRAARRRSARARPRGRRGRRSARERFRAAAHRGVRERRLVRTGSPGRPGGSRLEQPPGAAAEVDDVEPALLGGVGDALGEIERAVDDLRRSRRAGSTPIAATIARSVREATIGSRDPLDPDARAGAVAALARRRAARARRSCRRGRTCRSRGRSSGAPSATRRLSRAQADASVVRERLGDALLILARRAARGTGSPSCGRSHPRSPGTCPRRSRTARACTDWRWIDGRYGAQAIPSAAEAGHDAVAVDAARELHDVDEPRAFVVGVVGERAARRRRPASSSRVARGDLAARRRGSRSSRSSWPIPSAAEMSSSR